MKQVEQFALRHYVKAIDYLKPHFALESTVSFQTILIACVVFVSFEFLRGHFETAQSHLQSGLKIMKEANLFPENRGSKSISFSQHSLTNDWIMEAFFRLHILIGLFKYPDHDSDM